MTKATGIKKQIHVSLCRHNRFKAKTIGIGYRELRIVMVPIGSVEIMFDFWICVLGFSYFGQVDGFGCFCGFVFSEIVDYLPVIDSNLKVIDSQNQFGRFLLMINLTFVRLQGPKYKSINTKTTVL